MLPLRLAAAVLPLLLAAASGAEGAAGSAGAATVQEKPQEKVGGVVLGDPQWRRSHFSAQGQGYSYPSHLVPRSWARDGGGAPGSRRSAGDAGSAYPSKRTYDARRFHRDRHYEARRHHRDRHYEARRYHRDRSYARDRYFRNRRYANERY